VFAFIPFDEWVYSKAREAAREQGRSFSMSNITHFVGADFCAGQ
jgi:hypothetical protein